MAKFHRYLLKRKEINSFCLLKPIYRELQKDHLINYAKKSKSVTVKENKDSRFSKE